MIEFSCPNCGKHFSMAEKFAGRSGTCKQCQAPLVVPHPQPPALPTAPPPAPGRIVVELPAAPSPAPAVRLASRPAAAQPASLPAAAAPATPLASAAVPQRSSAVRARRLTADAAQVAAAFRNSPHIRLLATAGDPIETYQIQYNVRGLERGPNGQPVLREQHRAEIQLTREYPRQSPKCKILTPIFHPNIEPAVVCVGDHWTAGERLVDLIVRIGEMIAYQAYNIKSPLDGEAAMWADLHRDHLPIDNRNLQPAESA
jgi:ubiquitin-protein ligase